MLSLEILLNYNRYGTPTTEKEQVTFMKMIRTYKRRILPVFFMLALLFFYGCQCEGQIGKNANNAGEAIKSGLQVDNK